MKKFQILGIALIAVFLFGAISAVSASAETAFWLEDGTAITSLISFTMGGLIGFSLSAFGATIGVHCGGQISVGSIGANGESEITEVLNETKEKVGTNLTGTFENCEVTTSGLCTLKSLAEVWPVNLPWHGHLLLMETPQPAHLHILLAETGKIPGYEAKCSGSLGSFSDRCEGQTSSSVENTAGISMNNIYSEAVGTETMPCESGTVNLEGEELLELLNGLTLTASMTLP